MLQDYGPGRLSTAVLWGLNSTIVGLKQEERQLLEFMVDAFKQYYSRIETSK